MFLYSLNLVIDAKDFILEDLILGSLLGVNMSFMKLWLMLLILLNISIAFYFHCGNILLL